MRLTGWSKIYIKLSNDLQPHHEHSRSSKLKTRGKSVTYVVIGHVTRGRRGVAFRGVKAVCCAAASREDHLIREHAAPFGRVVEPVGGVGDAAALQLSKQQSREERGQVSHIKSIED